MSRSRSKGQRWIHSRSVQAAFVLGTFGIIAAVVTALLSDNANKPGSSSALQLSSVADTPIPRLSVSADKPSVLVGEWVTLTVRAENRGLWLIGKQSRYLFRKGSQGRRFASEVIALIGPGRSTLAKCFIRAMEQTECR